MEQEKKEFGLWWFFVTALIIGSIVMFTILSYTGKVTGTIVERKVFENSYQRSEGMKSRISAWNAQLASINSQLLTEKDENKLTNLKAQKAMLEMQIAETKGMK